MSCLKSLHFIKGFSIDYMHCALLGVSKLLLSLWTDPARCRNTDHNLVSSISLIDSHMKGIQVPLMITRKPRGLCELKHWKGQMESVIDETCH